VQEAIDDGQFFYKLMQKSHLDPWNFSEQQIEHGYDLLAITDRLLGSLSQKRTLTTLMNGN